MLPKLRWMDERGVARHLREAGSEVELGFGFKDGWLALQRRRLGLFHSQAWKQGFCRSMKIKV